jgi:molybdopterin-guanine dinucleotide biosynthesis protein A
VADELIVVSAQDSPDLPFPPDAVVVHDTLPFHGPLVGIYTGLEAASSEKSIVVACDMPFLNTGLLRYMVEISGDYDAVVPRLDDGMPEPLHSVYSKKCLDIMKKDIENGQLKVYVFLKKLNIRYLELDESRKIDPHSLSFFNINKPSDIDIAAYLAEKDKTV